MIIHLYNIYRRYQIKYLHKNKNSTTIFLHKLERFLRTASVLCDIVFNQISIPQKKHFIFVSLASKNHFGDIAF